MPAPGRSAHRRRAPAPAAVLSKAVVRAARLLELTQRDVATSLGISEATASRLFAGKYLLSADRAKEWELALLLVRLYRSLDALWGHEETARRWLASEPRARCAAAGSSADRRRPRPCRRVPGRRAQSRLASARAASRCGGRWRRSTSCRRWRSSTRSTSSSSSNGCWTRASRRFPRAPPACTICSSRPSATRRRLAARAFADPTTRACSTAPTSCAPHARSSATGAGVTFETRPRSRHAGARADGFSHACCHRSRRPAGAAPRARPRLVDASVRLRRLPAFRGHRARSGRGRDPLRIGPRPVARGLLRGARHPRVRASPRPWSGRRGRCP